MNSRRGRRFISWFRYVLLCAGVAALSGLSSRAATPKFFDDDPIWLDPSTQDVKNATAKAAKASKAKAGADPAKAGSARSKKPTAKSA